MKFVFAARKRGEGIRVYADVRKSTSLKISSGEIRIRLPCFSTISFSPAPLLYYSLFHESLHKRMHLAQYGDSYVTKHGWKFSGYAHPRFPLPSFWTLSKGLAGHIESIRLPRFLSKSKSLSARLLRVTAPFVVRFKHGNSINQESANF